MSVAVPAFVVAGSCLVLLNVNLGPTACCGFPRFPDEIAEYTRQLTITFGIAITISILALFAAILLSRYKRLGLFLAALTFGIAETRFIDVEGTGQGSLLDIFAILVGAVALTFIAIYLIHTPEKTFFQLKINAISPARFGYKCAIMRGLANLHQASLCPITRILQTLS